MDLIVWLLQGDTNRSAHATYWVTAEGDFTLLYVSLASWTNGSGARVHSCVCHSVRAECVGAYESGAQTSERSVFDDI